MSVVRLRIGKEARKAFNRVAKHKSAALWAELEERDRKAAEEVERRREQEAERERKRRAFYARQYTLDLEAEPEGQASPARKRAKMGR